MEAGASNEGDISGVNAYQILHGSHGTEKTWVHHLKLVVYLRCAPRQYKALWICNYRTELHTNRVAKHNGIFLFTRWQRYRLEVNCLQRTLHNSTSEIRTVQFWKKRETNKMTGI